MDRAAERKRIYLERYKTMRERIEEIEIHLGELHGLRSPNLDGMPHGKGGSSDLSVMASLAEEYKEELGRLTAECRNIEDAIRDIEDPDVRRVMYARFIGGMSLIDIHTEWVKEDIDMVYNRIYYLYQKGLQDIVVHPLSSP